MRVSTGTSAPRSASLEGQRQLALEVGAVAGERVSGGSRTTTTRSPPPGPALVSLIRLPVSAPGGIVISRRLPSTSTRRVVPWKASSRVISAVGLVRGRSAAGPRPPAAPAAGAAVDAHPAQDVLEAQPAGRPRCRGRPGRGALGAAGPRRRRTSGRSRRTRRDRRRPELVADVAAPGPPDPAKPPNGAAGAARPHRRARPADRLPVGPELVVLLALGRVAQDLVGLVDLLERRSAAASPGLASGWCWRASLRKAFLISAGDAVRGTPRTA